MKWLKKIYERADSLQQIQELFLNGIEKRNIESQSYDDRLRDNSEAIQTRLSKIYVDDEDELDTALDELDQALASYMNVHMEIGILLGARLLMTLLHKE